MLLGVTSLRQGTAEVRDGLVGIHPHPGPSERRERRRDRRREGRRIGREGDGGRERRDECTIVTWNVQRLSMREENRRRLRRVCDRVIRERWEVVLLSELLAEESGVVWLGEGESECAVVHGKKAGVLLRGRALRLWRDEGQQKWFGERVAAGVCGGLRLVAVYQPSMGVDEEGMERYRW